MKDDRLYLLHISESLERIEEYVAEGREAFFADRKTQDAVAEERQPRVGVGALVGPRRVREDLAAECFGQGLEQSDQLIHAAGACSRTKSMAWPTVRMRAACWSLIFNS